MTPETDYPTETDLQTIRTWPLENGWRELLVFVAERWTMGNWTNRKVGYWFAFSTGGWSGNEELIAALQSNEIFWLCCWQSSRRGGYWEFEVSNGND